jgi:predicted ester cyclase
MREHNIGVVRRWLDEGWTHGDVAVADDLLTDDFLLHDPVANREVVGRDAEQALITGFRKAIPDLAFSIDDLVADGDGDGRDLPGMLRTITGG